MPRIVAAGRRPRLAGLGLERLGVPATPVVDAAGRVAGCPGVWVAGDALGRDPFTHAAEQEGEDLALALLGEQPDPPRRTVPRAVYTEPAVLSVGRTPVADPELLVGRQELATTARGQLDPQPGGVVEVYADPGTGVLVGACAVGVGAVDWMGQAVLAVHLGLRPEQALGPQQAFPTHSEAYALALRDLPDR